MFVPAATAWRMASEPEWAKVPSPRFWNTCAVPENGAAPTQCTPSPPICVRPTVCRSMVRAIEWQPMPPPASEPSGTTVERLCGQPEQKKDLRATASGAGLSLLVSLADHPRPHRLLEEDVARVQLDEAPLLLDDEQLLQAPRELADDAGLEREQHAELEQPDAEPTERLVVEPERPERLAHVIVRLPGGGDAEPGIGRGHADAVQAVGRGERPGRLDAVVEQLALHLEAPGRELDHAVGGPPRPALHGEARIDHADPVRRHLGGSDLVGDVGDDLERHPAAGVPGQLEAQAAEVQHLLPVDRKS